MAVIRSSVFQNWAVQKATTYLQKELLTKVDIGRIELRFPGVLLLKDLSLFDQQGDTLIHATELRASLYRSYRGKGDLGFNTVELTNPAFFMQRRSDGFNYNFLIDYFTPSEPNSTTKAVAIVIDELKLNNGRFLYRDWQYEAGDYGPFQENNILVENIYTEMHEFYLLNDSMHTFIQHLRATEQSGIEIASMHSEATVCPTELSFENLRLETGHSSLAGKVIFNYEHYNQLSYFIDSVDINSVLNQSRVSSEDLAYFSYDMEGFQDEFYLDGPIEGRVNNIKSTGLILTSDKMGSFQGRMRLKGLPDWRTTYMNLDCRDLEVNSAQLLWMLGGESMPEEVERLGNIHYQGDFVGFYNDFVALGDLDTDLGELSGDVNFKIDGEGTAAYSGELSSKGFDFGKMYALSDLGEAAFQVQLNGKGLELESFEVDLDGKVDRLNFAGYTYRGITLDGQLENRFFTGELRANDSNAQFAFGGTIDLNGLQPTYNFLADVKQLNLGKLGFDDENSRVSGEMDIRITGSTLDDLFGLARLQKLDVYRNNKRYQFTDIALLSEIAGYERDIILNSEMLEGHLHGNFLLSQVDEVWKELRASLLPDYYDPPVSLSSEFELDLEASIYSANKLTDLLDLPLELSSGEVTGFYKSEGKELGLTLSLQKLSYDLLKVSDLNLRANKAKGEMLVFEEYSAGIHLGNRLFSRRSSIQGKVGGNRTEFSISMADSTDRFFINANGQTLFANQAVYLTLKNGNIRIDQDVWHLDSTNSLEYRNTTAVLRNFNLKRGDQELRIDADVGSDKQEGHIYLSRFDLSLINRFLSDTLESFGGIASGLLSTENSFSRPLIYSDLLIEDLQYRKDTLGDLKLISNTITPSRPLEMSVTASVQNGLLKDLLLNGTIDISPEANYMDLELEWNDGDVRPLERFTEGIASGLSGTINAKALVKGPLQEPSITGMAQFDNTHFTIDYLGTEYHFSHRVAFSEKELTLQAVKVLDKSGNAATVNGRVDHNYLSDIRYLIEIDNVKNLLCLNTQKEDNELFYGTAYADGSCLIRGDLYDVDFKIRAKSKKGTHLYLPLDYSEENVTAGFVKFTAFSNKWDNDNAAENETRGGYTMDFNLELTKDAEVWLIFDEQLGDIIKGSGAGNIKMEMNSEGAFYMYGDYIIDNGKYQYTALNFFSKEFNIEKGSKLQWDGDPYQARIDITALKREMAAPYDLMAAYSNDQAMLEQMRSNVPVDCKLELTGLLLNPEIRFDFEISDLGGTPNSAMAAQFNTIIQQIKTDADEVNRQVFSLLVLGTFIPPTFGESNANTTALTGVQNTYRNSVSDLISNQLSNWISQIDPKWQVGLNWQAAGEQTARELIVSVKRKFLNERLEFAGSVDAGSSYNYTPYNLNLRYNISSDGRFMVHGFTRQVNDPTLGNITNITTTGVGLYYRKQFDRIFRRKKETTQQSEDETP